PIPSRSGGPCYILVKADCADQVREEDETNNIGTSSLIIVGSPSSSGKISVTLPTPVPGIPAPIPTKNPILLPTTIPGIPAPVPTKNPILLPTTIPGTPAPPPPKPPLPLTTTTPGTSPLPYPGSQHPFPPRTPSPSPLPYPGHQHPFPPRNPPSSPPPYPGMNVPPRQSPTLSSPGSRCPLRLPREQGQGYRSPFRTRGMPRPPPHRSPSPSRGTGSSIPGTLLLDRSWSHRSPLVPPGPCRLPSGSLTGQPAPALSVPVLMQTAGSGSRTRRTMLPAAWQSSFTQDLPRPLIRPLPLPSPPTWSLHR